jgi:hypothetical protein
MNYKLTHRIVAAVVFLISLVVLILTVQPSVSFWDAGEFIAAGYYLQVPHPPGTPFFLLLGRIFSMIPLAENIALRVNFISVISSALSVLFLYLVAVKLIENFRGKVYNSPFEAIIVFVAAAIGALSFSFSDTFWFNGVEAEVYALSTLLAAAITWLMILWNEKADRKDNEKYLLMIAYLIGLSTGVHLMSVLAIVPVVMVIVFRKYLEDEAACRKTAYIFMAHVGILLLIAIGMWMGERSSVPPSPEEYKAFDSKMKIIFVVASVFIMGIFFKKVFSRNSFYLPLMIGGAALFITYPGVVKELPGFLAWAAKDNNTVAIVLLALIFAGFGFLVYYSVKHGKRTLNLISLSVLFILIGFTTFAMVIIRSNQNPPMNENEPNTFTELVSYLNREQYGEFPTFKRRFTAESHQTIVYNSYNSDLHFFWDYQMHHMMTRYLLWNYAGRQDWSQDSGANIAPFNAIGNFFGKIVNVHFAGDAKDSLFAIPLLLGLFGIYYHFRRDWKMAAVFMVMFILLGYLTAFYQNQQQPQPRERDYFYVGAFFVFSIWIALGVYGLAQLLLIKLKEKSYRNAAVVTVLALGIVFVPVKMLAANYFTHDRSNNWVPWDYAYNLLQSCAPNAVLFTNGDNDTFPLWYLQDVEGVRRDVKVANLSLLNTSWYIKQLKNNDPYNVGTVNMRLSDEQIERIRPVQWEPIDVRINVPPPGEGNLPQDLVRSLDIRDSSILNQGHITFRMNNTLTVGNIKAVRVQDLMVKEIVEANNWERPIVFAVTVSDDSKIGMQDYLKMEGMGQRLVPERRRQNEEFLNPELMRQQLFNEPEEFSRDYRPGFKFRSLSDPDVFLDENHQRMTQNYRNAFIRLALYHTIRNENQLALESLNMMEERLPRNLVNIDFFVKYQLSDIYYRIGGIKEYNEIASELEAEAWSRIEQNPADAGMWNPYRVLLDIYENTQNHSMSYEVWQRLARLYPTDPNVRNNVEKYKLLSAEQDTSGN